MVQSWRNAQVLAEESVVSRVHMVVWALVLEHVDPIPTAVEDLAALFFQILNVALLVICSTTRLPKLLRAFKKKVGHRAGPIHNMAMFTRARGYIVTPTSLGKIEPQGPPLL